MATRPYHFEAYVTSIRKNPSVGKLIETDLTGPPCLLKETTKKFQIEPICNILKNVSRNDNRNAFLKLMKFTKQSPTYLLEKAEYLSMFNNASAVSYGYSLKNNQVKVNWFECFFNQKWHYHFFNSSPLVYNDDFLKASKSWFE